MSISEILTLAINLAGTGVLTLFVWRIQQNIAKRDRKIDARDAMRDEGRSLAVQIDQALGDLSTECAAMCIRANPADTSWVRLDEMIKTVRDLCRRQKELVMNQGTMTGGKKE